MTPDIKLTFGQALEGLKAGLRARRAPWAGHGMWLAIASGSEVPPDAINKPGPAAMIVGDMRERVNLQILPHIDMRTPDGTLAVGWQASQADLLAEDWELLTPDGQPLGADGTFSDGKIVPEDEGGLTMAVGAVDGNVAISFGKPVAWLALSPDQARQFAGHIVQKASEISGATR